MSALPRQDLIDGQTRLMSLTVGQYHRMIAAGILPEGEPYELLGGLLIHKVRSAEGDDPMTVGHEHAWSVTALEELNPRLRRMGCHLRIHQPVTLPPYDEPGPDGAIVRGTKDVYRQRHPGAGDVLCAVEVADASLRRDRTTKQAVYANSGIGQYVIVNLPGRAIEVYTAPLVGKGRYAQSRTLSVKQRVEFPVARGKHLAVAVGSLLPR